MSASPVAASAATRLRRPGASIPSSLLTSTRGLRAGAIVASSFLRCGARLFLAEPAFWKRGKGNARARARGKARAFPLIRASNFRRWFFDFLGFFWRSKSEPTTLTTLFSVFRLSLASVSLSHALLFLTSNAPSLLRCCRSGSSPPLRRGAPSAPLLLSERKINNGCGGPRARRKQQGKRVANARGASFKQCFVLDADDGPRFAFLPGWLLWARRVPSR